jgi:hypothetical protein
MAAEDAKYAPVDSKDAKRMARMQAEKDKTEAAAVKKR